MDAHASRYRFDGPLFFVCREKRVDLDFYPVAGGFLASAPLLAILTRLAPAGLVLTEVTMVEERGTPNAREVMTFRQAVDRRGVRDPARMDIGGARHPELDSPDRAERSHGVARSVTALHGR